MKRYNKKGKSTFEQFIHYRTMYLREPFKSKAKYYKMMANKLMKQLNAEFESIKSYQ